MTLHQLGQRLHFLQTNPKVKYQQGSDQYEQLPAQEVRVTSSSPSRQRPTFTLLYELQQFTCKMKALVGRVSSNMNESSPTASTIFSGVESVEASSTIIASKSPNV